MASVVEQLMLNAKDEVIAAKFRGVAAGITVGFKVATREVPVRTGALKASIKQRTSRSKKNGKMFGEGVKTRIKEKLLTDCNLHTIVRLPNGVFSPYTGIKTNLLFFTKGEPTKDVWFYEHPYPAGAKSYNKTKPIRIEEFDTEKKWWKKRKENSQAWKVSVEQLQANGYNLDVKNPHDAGGDAADADQLLADYQQLLTDLQATRDRLKHELMSALGGESS